MCVCCSDQCTVNEWLQRVPVPHHLLTPPPPLLRHTQALRAWRKKRATPPSPSTPLSPFTEQTLSRNISSLNGLHLSEPNSCGRKWWGSQLIIVLSFSSFLLLLFLRKVECCDFTVSLWTSVRPKEFPQQPCGVVKKKLMGQTQTREDLKEEKKERSKREETVVEVEERVWRI